MNPLGKWTLLGCTVLLLAACVKPTPPVIEVPATSQTAFSNGINFTSGDSGPVAPSPGAPQTPVVQTETVTFTAPSPWTASVVETKAVSWLTVQPASGDAGEVRMTVTAQPNDTYEDRAAEVTIRSGEATITLKVRQAAKPRPVEVSSITLDQTSAALTAGETLQLSATVSPDNAADKSVTWTSSITEAATVGDAGLVTAVAPGTAVIEAKSANGLSAKCEVTVSAPATPDPENPDPINPDPVNPDPVNPDPVNPDPVAPDPVTPPTPVTPDPVTPAPTPAIIPATSLTLDQTSASIQVDETLQLTATVSPDNATDKSVTWYTLAPEIASISESGLVKGLAPGSAVVGAKTANGLTAECEIVVLGDSGIPGGYVDIVSITVDPTEKEINVGESFKLTATVGPDNATDKTVYWRSSSTSIASVSSDGTVTGNKAGTATIYAYRTTLLGEDITGTCTVTVVQKVTSITLNITRAHLAVGNTITLYPTVTPEDAPSAGSLEWKSSDESVATVDATGKVTALAVGTTEISVSADGITAKCTVTVESVSAGNEGTSEEIWK